MPPPPPALFAFAHPDDETLAAGVAVAEHVRAGQEVHVLWLTAGEASGVRQVLNGTGTSAWWGVPHDPAGEGYPALTAVDFAEARDVEAGNAVRALASGYPGTLTVHHAALPDGGVTQPAVAAAVDVLREDIAGGGPVRVKTHSWLVDDHPDHVAAGQAVKGLAAADPDLWPSPRYYILPAYWADGRLSQVADVWDLPADSGVAARCRNAYRAFGAWSPPRTYAVGWHSVPAQFGTLDAGPRSLYHP